MTNIKDEFRRRRNLQIKVTFTAVPFFLTLVFAENIQNSSYQEFFFIILGISAVLFIGFIVFTLRNWRCPSCNKYLRKNLNPKYCPHCGIQLRD